MSAILLERPAAARSTPVVRSLVLALARCLLRPLVVRGPMPAAGVVLAANHASHADTPAIMRAVRRRELLAPAAAQDYFFGGRVRRFISEAIGAFPFPRTGDAGLIAAREQLRAGRIVLLFPEGTRSLDGRIGRFRGGIGRLASDGAPVVPVGIAGTQAVLAKGRRIPRRAPVAVCFGSPLPLAGMEPRAATAIVEAEVRALTAQARAALPPARRTVYERASAFARSPAAPVLLFVWALTEAIVFPIVPDVGIALLVLAAPARAPVLVVAALAGTMTGASIAYPLGGTELLAHVPLVTDPMREAAHGWLTTEGASGVAHQPWSGVPYKTFALQAAGADVPLGALLWETVLARGARFVEVAAVFGLVGCAGRRIALRAYGAVSVLLLALFVAGLVRVVAAWS